jgi:CheY-like chemotaxis protein
MKLMSKEALTGRLILAVEDEYFLADELDRDLKAAGATVLGPVSSLAAALESLTNATPDAAVLDMNLGGKMAHPLADALVARNVPFLFITGYDQTALPERFAMVRRLEKPVDTRAMIKELSRLLNTAPTE